MTQSLFCKKCGKQLTENNALSDGYGAHLCAKDYLVLIPAYSGKGIDPQLTRAAEMVEAEQK